MSQTKAQLVVGLNVNASAPATALQIDASGNINLDSNTLYVDASNNRVGIGTSAPQALLHLSSSIITESFYTATGTGGRTYRIGTGDNTSGLSGALRIYDETGAATRLLINSSGRVGIGTTSPGAELQVNGNIRTSGAAGTGYELNDVNTKISIPAANSIAFTTSALERARIDNAGRLLVGTSSTSGNIAGSDKLAVVITGDNTQGGISVTDYAGTSSTVGSYAALRLQRSIGTTDGSFTALTASSWGLGRIEFNGSNGVGFGTGATIEGVADSLAWGNGDHPARLVFSTTADGASSPTQRLVIKNNGLFGFFDGTPTFSFANTAGFQVNSTGAILTSVESERCAFLNRRTTDGSIIDFARSATTVGSISVTTTATAYNTSSDYRLKENVTIVTDGIARLQQLKPSRFNFIADPDKTVDGFLAHEVQTIVPEAITGEKDAVDDEGNPQYQGIDQSKLVPLLTAALQEAVAKIESLEARLTAAGI